MSPLPPEGLDAQLLMVPFARPLVAGGLWHREEEGRELQTFRTLSIRRFGRNPFLSASLGLLLLCGPALQSRGWLGQDEMTFYFSRF